MFSAETALLIIFDGAADAAPSAEASAAFYVASCSDILLYLSYLYI